MEAHQEVLFDLSKQPSDLKWDQVSLRHDRDDVWMEETWRNPAATDEKHANQRAYVTCNYDMINPSNWLFSHFIEVQSARRVYVELLFNTRDCEAYLNPKSCKETFSVYLKQFKTSRPGTTKIEKDKFEKDIDDWKNIGRLARSNSNMTTETIGMEIEADTKMIRIAFEEQGICLSLLNVKIYYRICDEFTDQLVHFRPQVTGPKETDMVRMNGTCIPNASRKIAGVDLIGLCMSTGSGIKTSGECVCDSGYSQIQDSNGARCESCPPNTYKPKGQTLCKPCPVNSISGEAASTCRCVNGYFRAEDELVSQPCSQPPSRPIKLVANAITASSARLSWNEPSSLGGRPEIWYEVRCSGRGECGAVVVSPADKRLSTRSVQINGLRPASDYTFLVFARNKVSSEISAVGGAEKSAVIDLRTRSEEEDVPPVSHLRVDASQSDGVTIAWSVADSDVTDFEIEVRPAILKPQRAFETRHINMTYTTFIGLRHDTVYQFRVRVKDDLRWSQSISYQVGRGLVSHAPMEESGESKFLNQTGSALLIIIALILVVIAVALCMIVVQKKTKNRKQMSDLDVLDTYKQDSMTPDYHTASRHHHHQGNLPANLHEQLRSTTKLNAPLIPSFGSPISQPPPYYGGVHSGTSGKYKTYVDPTTYEDPYQALIEFTFDISPNDVFITQVIGGGEFGDVCLGGLSRNSPAAAKWGAGATVARGGGAPSDYETVAIKTLKSGSSAKAKAEFLTEATIMGQFSHPNVIRLIGVVTSSEPVMIVAEYMANGSLDQFLRSADQQGEKVAWEKITEMLYGIASGMKYLTDMGYVHRDLAARNVLLDQELRCKIADFGLSRGVRSEGSSIEPEYTTNGGKIPVRWTAPEAITHRKFTPSSDVWSFGVVIWEVCSFGERPYWDWTNQKVISEVMIGYRLPPPMDCPMGLYRVAQWCWKMERHERPTFTQLLATFHKLILQPALIEQDIGELPRRVGYGTVPPTPPSSAAPLPSLDDFLRQIGLNHVYGKLVSNNIHSVSDLAATSHLDLLACGLISPECSVVRDGLNGRISSGTPPSSSGTLHATTRGTRTTRPTAREEGFFV